MLASVGTPLGVALAMWLTPVLTTLAPADLPQMASVSFDRRVLMFSIGLVLLTTLLFGLGPSVAISNTAPVGHLREGRGVAGRRRGRLVMVEVALAFVLLVGASLLGETVIRLATQPVGFEAENVLVATVRYPPSAGETAAGRALSSRLLEERLAAVPGVRSVAGAASLPFAGGYGSNRIDVEGETLSESIAASRQMVTSRYFTTLRLPLLKGRTL